MIETLDVDVAVAEALATMTEAALAVDDSIACAELSATR
jgi:hypothetical protein